MPSTLATPLRHRPPHAWLGLLALAAATHCAHPPQATMPATNVPLQAELNIIAEPTDAPAPTAPATSAEPTDQPPPGVVTLGQGTPRVVHFFTTYSLSSFADTEMLASLPPATVIGITLDLDAKRAIAPWRDTTRARYAVVSWPNWLAASGDAPDQPPLVPTTLLIGGDGTIILRRAGQLRAADFAVIKQTLAP